MHVISVKSPILKERGGTGGCAGRGRADGMVVEEVGRGGLADSGALAAIDSPVLIGN